MEKARFLGSVGSLEQLPPESRPEIALAGRSNAGKSSLINAITGLTVAKVSKTPGKTITLNFFDIGKYYRIVDMPGYGFSKRSGDEQASWEGLVEGYLKSRPALMGILLVIDSRREWTRDEEQLAHWLAKNGIPLALVLTKSDKLSRQEKKNVLNHFQKHCGDVFLVSSQTREGIAEMEESIFNAWIRNPKSKGGV